MTTVGVPSATGDGQPATGAQLAHGRAAPALVRGDTEADWSILNPHSPENRAQHRSRYQIIPQQKYITQKPAIMLHKMVYYIPTAEQVLLHWYIGYSSPKYRYYIKTKQ